MVPLSERALRASFRNCSRGERESLTLPDLRSLDWEALPFLGWRDPKAPLRGYLVRVQDDGPVGVVLRAPETRVRRTAQCLLCHSVHSDGVALFTARRLGAAGKRGSTIGTYVCDDLRCPDHLRASLRPSRQLPDPAPVLAARTEEMLERLDGFLAGVLREQP